MLHCGEILATELLDEEFGVGVDFTGGMECPTVAFGSHIYVMHIVVAVVDDVCLESRRGDGLHVHWHEGDIGI